MHAVDSPGTKHRRSAPEALRAGWLKRPISNRFTPLQLAVMTLATVAPLIVGGAVVAGLIGVISVEGMRHLALVAGENPGMLTFGATLLASPVQWFTGRSQVRVRKYLAIVFSLLAFSNGAMFVLEAGLPAALGAPFLVAGSIALLLAIPLFLTSSLRAQRLLGMRNWRRLHRLTYVIAAALLAHVILIGDIGPGAVMIAAGLVARIPAIRRRIARPAERRESSS